MRKKYITFLILSIIIIILIPISNFIAFQTVTEAVYHKFGLDSYSGSIKIESSAPIFTGKFIWENTANIPLTIDVVNIEVFVYNGNPEVNGTMLFTGPPHLPDSIPIGNIVANNLIIPANGKNEIIRDIPVTSKDALNLIQNGNYVIQASYYELTVTGTYLFWHFTSQIAFQ